MWHVPAELPPLSDQAVHLWSIRLDASSAPIHKLSELLTVDECERAAAFRFADLRRRFVVTRASLRQLLALYVGVTPSGLRFSYGAQGKPSLVHMPQGLPVSFNVSHSNELALIAVTRGRDVGVDVEVKRTIDDMDMIADYYFCARERDMLRSVQGESKTGLFLSYWTRKEAILKATGDGLSVPLDQVDVSGAFGLQPRPLLVSDGAGAPRELALVDLQPDSHYVGALAVEGAGWQFSGWRWPDTGEVKWSAGSDAQFADP